MNEYVSSRKFLGLSNSSKRIYSNGIDTLSSFYAGVNINDISRFSIISMRDELYDKPGKCKVALNVLNNILGYAYDRGWVIYNHARGVGDLPPSKPIERWWENEIDYFMQTAPDHLKEVMMLALYTGQRRSDLVRMQWTDYNGKTFHVKQRKTGIELWIPVHPKLKLYLQTMPRDGDLILLNYYSEPWVPDSMRAAMKRHCLKIGLKGKMLHGIRKTTASILAEMGCTTKEIMAITGHQTLKEVGRYTEDAERKTMAVTAMNKWRD